MTAKIKMSVTIEPLPVVVHCSGRECGATIRTEDAPGAGWVMLAGAWFCAVDAELCRQRVIADMEALDEVDELDDVDQSDPEGLPGVGLEELGERIAPGGRPVLLAGLMATSGLLLALLCAAGAP